MVGFEWLSAVYGVVAFVLCATLWALARRFSVPARKEHYQDQALGLLKRKLDIQAENVRVDEELAELWTKAPEPRMRWIVRSVEEARLFPPRLLELAYRFGFSVPSPKVVWQEYGGAKPAPEPAPEPDAKPDAKPSDEEQPPLSPVVRLNAWSQPIKRSGSE